MMHSSQRRVLIFPSGGHGEPIIQEDAGLSQPPDPWDPSESGRGIHERPGPWVQRPSHSSAVRPSTDKRRVPPRKGPVERQYRHGWHWVIGLHCLGLYHLSALITTGLAESCDSHTLFPHADPQACGVALGWDAGTGEKAYLPGTGGKMNKARKYSRIRSPPFLECSCFPKAMFSLPPFFKNTCTLA